jgi:hypothetical protein
MGARDNKRRAISRGIYSCLVSLRFTGLEGEDVSCEKVISGRSNM